MMINYQIFNQDDYDFMVVTDSGIWMYRDEPDQGDIVTKVPKSENIPTPLKRFLRKHSWMLNDPLAWKKDEDEETYIKIGPKIKKPIPSMMAPTQFNAVTNTLQRMAKNKLVIIKNVSKKQIVIP